MPMTSNEMIKLLEKKGFREISNKSGHRKMKNFKTGNWTVVPMHGGKELNKGIEHKILKQAGLLD